MARLGIVALLASNIFMLAFAIAVLGGWLILPQASFTEGAWIEVSTATILLTSALLIAVWRPYPQTWLWPACLLTMGLRELDLHKAFTSSSIFKSRFYLGDAPTHEKLAGLVVIGLLIYLLYCCAKRVPDILHQLRQGSLIVWLAVNALLLMGLGRAIDSMSRILPWLHQRLPAHAQTMHAEEVLELGGSIVMLAACIIWLWKQKAKPPAAG